MITEINESKTWTKHISCKCECKFDSKNCNSNQKCNNDKRRCECKNPKEHHVCEKDYIWNPATYTCKNGKYLGSIIDDSVVACDEIIEAIKAVPTKTVTTKVASTNFYILLTFLSITIALLIAVSIYCCLINYRQKQKHFLWYHNTSSKLKRN